MQRAHTEERPKAIPFDVSQEKERGILFHEQANDYRSELGSDAENQKGPSELDSRAAVETPAQDGELAAALNSREHQPPDPPPK